MREAFQSTIELAQAAGMEKMDTIAVDGSLSFAHLMEMRDRIAQNTPPFSEAKLGRWLGWAQAAVVAAGCGTLQDMKNINMRWSDDS